MLACEETTKLAGEAWRGRDGKGLQLWRCWEWMQISSEFLYLPACQNLMLLEWFRNAIWLRFSDRNSHITTLHSSTSPASGIIHCAIFIQKDLEICTECMRRKDLSKWVITLEFIFLESTGKRKRAKGMGIRLVYESLLRVIAPEFIFLSSQASKKGPRA